MNRPSDYPTSLNGGESQDPADVRTGERHRRSPKISQTDPAEEPTPAARRDGDEKPDAKTDDLG